MSCAAAFLTGVVQAQMNTAPVASGGMSPIPGASGGGSLLGDWLGNATPAVGTSGACKAPEGGATCGGAGPTSQGNTSGVDTGAGNPINVTNGNKYQMEVDLPALPGELGIEIVRYYNSANRHVVGQLGMGWRLSYETDLYVVGQSVQILRADGARLTFNIDPGNPSVCAGADPVQGWVRILTDARGGKEYLWHWTHGEGAGRTLRFDARGHLVQITAASGAVLAITRGPKGELVKVTDPQGRVLSFNHGGRASVRAAEQQGGAVFTGIQSIDSPLGRYSYAHGASADAPKPDGEQDGASRGARATTPEFARAQVANLVQVSLPTHVNPDQGAHPWANRPASASAIRRVYHYEDVRHPQALTGISVVGSGSDGALLSERLSTYRYDERGRAILSVRGIPAEVGQAETDDVAPATAANGIGQVEVRILEPALPTRRGRTLLTNGLGQETLYTHQVIAGEYRLLEAVGAGCAECGPVNLRWRYDAAGRLVEQTALTPVQVKEGQLQGKSEPLIATRHMRGVQGGALRIEQVTYIAGRAQAPQLIERQEYADSRWPDKPTLIARPSVITGAEYQIALSYNAAGQVTESTERGWSPLDGKGAVAASLGQATALQRTTTYTYRDVDGRSVLTAVDGPLANGPANSPEDSDVTTLEWDARGSFVTRVTNPGGHVATYTRDDSGRTVRARLDDGYRQIDTQTRYAGPATLALQPERVVRVAHLLKGGEAVQASRLEQTLFEARHDALGRRTASTDPDGRTTRAEYVGAGAWPSRLTFPDGNSQPYAVGSESPGRGTATRRELTERRGASNGQAAESAGVTITRDALARAVAWQAGSDTLLQAAWGELGTAAQSLILALESANGRAQRLVDDFGRVVAVRSPGVDWQVAQYDAADRITRIADSRGAVQTAQYDLAGRLLHLERRLASAPSSAVETITPQWQGHLMQEISVVDADGERRIQYRHDAAGQVQEEMQEIALAGQEPVRFSVERERAAGGERIRLADAQGVHSTLVQTRDALGRVNAMRLAGALPAWLGGGRTLLQSVDWTNVAGTDYAQGVTYGNGRTDHWPLERFPADAAAQGTALHDVQPIAYRLARPGEGHDGAGLPRTLEMAAGRLELAWDAAARLKAVSRDERSEHFVYDARGRRVAKRIGRDIRYFAWDGMQLAGEANAQGRLVTRYAYLGWRAVAQVVREPGRWARFTAWLFGVEGRTFTTSRSGRVLAMHDGTGKLLWRDPAAGASDAGTAAIHQPLRDVGQYADDESGLVYHVARFFDSESGLFLSPDPQGIADTLAHTRSDLLLNAYAYAGGNPAYFFDPDGAAILTYYAITTGATGKALGVKQGFTAARWAFTITDVAGAGAGTGVESGILFDGGGDFLSALATGEKSAANTAVRWDTRADAGAITAAFAEHYGANRISISQFTIGDFDDAKAAALIDYLMKNDADRSKACKVAAPGWLPEIKFAEEEIAIQVTAAASVGAKKQRILACGDGSDKDLDQRRIAKYEAAAEINETGRINRDCSEDGCPGIGYYCDATKCYSPRDQLLYGPPPTTEPVYTPSYGRSQFIGTTLVEQLINGYASFTEEERSALGLTESIKQSLQTALGHGTRIATWFNRMNARKTYADANMAWANMSSSERMRFTAETGLGERDYIDMVRIKTQPPRNSSGDILLNDARAAIATAAIMRDPLVQAYLMDIIKDFDKFTIVAKRLMMNNMQVAKNSLIFDGTEEHLAAMVARAHNGGIWDRTLTDLKQSDSYAYVKRFLGFSSNQGASGDWPSLRCTESFGTENTVKPSTQGKGIGGLQLIPLILN